MWKEFISAIEQTIWQILFSVLRCGVEASPAQSVAVAPPAGHGAAAAAEQGSGRAAPPFFYSLLLSFLQSLLIHISEHTVAVAAHTPSSAAAVELPIGPEFLVWDQEIVQCCFREETTRRPLPHCLLILQKQRKTEIYKLETLWLAGDRVPTW